jgi:hypothetical protein
MVRAFAGRRFAMGRSEAWHFILPAALIENVTGLSVRL